MTHAEAQACLDAYFAGTLPREQVRAFHAHLKECEACRAGIRIRGAGLRQRQSQGPDFSWDPKTRQQLQKNRNLLIQIILMGFLALLLFKVTGRM